MKGRVAISVFADFFSFLKIESIQTEFLELFALVF